MVAGSFVMPGWGDSNGEEPGPAALPLVPELNSVNLPVQALIEDITLIGFFVKSLFIRKGAFFYSMFHDSITHWNEPANYIDPIFKD